MIRTPIDYLKVSGILLPADQLPNKSSDSVFNEFGPVFVLSRILVDRLQ
jgi:hypothetical protein